MNRSAVTIGAALALMLLSACRTDALMVPLLDTRDPQFTEEDLRRGLLGWAETLSSLIIEVSDELHGKAADRTLRRRAVLWKVRIIPLARRAVMNPDPQDGFVGALGLSVAMRQYLAPGGAGAGLFGELQPKALEASRKIEVAARRLGASFLGPDERDRLAGEIETLMLQYPIRGEFAADALVSGLTDPVAREPLGWVIDLPMAPFRALGGVNEGALAIREFNQVARSFAIMAEDVPRQLRWQSQLLAYDFEDRETVIEARAALDALAEGARELAALASALRGQADTGVPVALAETRAALADASRTLATAGELLEPLRGLTSQVETAGVAWQGAADAIRGGRDPEAATEGEPDEPFDILAYQQTAIEIANTAHELQTLVASIRDLAGGDEFPTALAALGGSIDRAQDGGRSLVDHAFWRALLLLVAFFALLLLYRWLPKPRSRDS